ncbi:MAG TPA: hypothetical protein VGQ29_12485 [Gemmatimonadales bacterium]|nr:hypothetical protein [Gemmatimonadales bacterium]
MTMWTWVFNIAISMISTSWRDAVFLKNSSKNDLVGASIMGMRLSVVHAR